MLGKGVKKAQGKSSKKRTTLATILSSKINTNH
jgi:hypothetical protein